MRDSQWEGFHPETELFKGPTVKHEYLNSDWLGLVFQYVSNGAPVQFATAMGNECHTIGLCYTSLLGYGAVH
jgi:hypothetical protein